MPRGEQTFNLFSELLNAKDDQSRDARVKTGIDSAFYSNVRNTTGLLATQSKADLKHFALSNPADYTKFRSRVYMDVVGNMVERNYETIWALLSDGIYEKGDGQFVQLDINGTQFHPNLPDQEISRLANGFAEAILKAFDEVLSNVLPDNYRDLAEDKIHVANKAAGLGNAMK